MVSRRPPASGVVETDEHPLAVLFLDLVPIDVRAPGRDVDVGEMEFRDVQRERHSPEKLSGGAVERPDAAGLCDLDDDVALLPAWNIRIDPFYRTGIGIDGRAQQGSLMNMIEVPVVARQMLVIPEEFAGLDVERDG